jgi:hypothetical protein
MPMPRLAPPSTQTLAKINVASSRPEILSDMPLQPTRRPCAPKHVRWRTNPTNCSLCLLMSVVVSYNLGSCKCCRCFHPAEEKYLLFPRLKSFAPFCRKRECDSVKMGQPKKRH